MKSLFQRHSTLFFLLALSLLTLAVYAPSFKSDLIFDDARLTDGTIFGSYGSLLDFRQRMLSYGSFVWLDALWTQKWALQRLFNVLIHLGVACSLFLLFDTLLKRLADGESADAAQERGTGASYRVALGVGIVVFALNPVAVYAVAYLVQRSILLAALFTVLGLWAFARALDARRWGWFVLALFFYVLAVLSKEQAAAAAAVAVPVYAYLRRPGWKELAPVVGAAVLLMGLVGLFLWRFYGQVLGMVFDENSRQFVVQLEALSPGIGQRMLPLSMANQMALFFQYGALWLLPYAGWMSIDLRPAFPLSFLEWRPLLGALGFVGLGIAAAWALLQRSGPLRFAGLCLLIPVLMFTTELATVWVQDPFVLYRSYLWAIALPGLVALLVAGLPVRLIVPATVALAALLSALTFERAMSLKNEMTAWSDAVAKVDLKAPANAVGRWRPFVNRGTAHLERGTPQAAFQDFAQAAALGEQYGSARFSMGMSLQLMNRHAEALAAFSQARAQGFDEAALYFHQGESLFSLGRFEEAYQGYSKALERKQAPEVEQHTRLRRAEAAVPAQRYADAIADLKQLVQRAPDNRRAQMALGMAYVGAKDPQAALAVFDQLIAAKPNAMAYYGQAMAHFIAGRRAQSLESLEQATALEPKNAMFRGLREQLAASR